MLYIDSDNKASFNLALEEHAVNVLAREDDVVMLWRNTPAIIIGRNQNAVKEINNGYVRKAGIDVVRRLSGGGAVYHDLGNLNYTFIKRAGGEGRIDFAGFCEPIVETLTHFGVRAEVGGRNDITVSGRKVCGNAQYTHNGMTMHHGCILFNTDLSALGRALRPDEMKLKSKGVSSVSSRVANLCEFLPEGVGMEEFKRELICVLAQTDEIKKYTLTPEDILAVQRLVDERYGLWQWNTGSSPAYEIERKAYYPGTGTVQVSLSVTHGIIEGIKINGDFFGSRDIAELEKLLCGTAAARVSIEERLAEIELSDYILNLGSNDFSGLLIP